MARDEDGVDVRREIHRATRIAPEQP